MAPRKRPIVLYVDDDRDDQELFTEIVKEIDPDIDCVIATDGVDALLLLPQIDTPACIFIDVNMPRMNGLELLKTIKGHPVYSSIPAIILTTSGSKMDELTALCLGASEYLTKPSSYKEFSKLLKNHVCISKGSETQMNF
jgi:CheY-like chemotaxis protein